MDRSTAMFERERGRLTAIVYGLLGSYTEAEDIVQEAWLRFREAPHDLRQPEAWLTTVVSRLALDRLRSARHRRETYPGVWLPEPVATQPDPEAVLQTRSRLSIAFLHLLEKLGPEERAVVVLRNAFDRTYQEISDILGKTEAACRQLLSRAQKRLQDEGRERLQPAPESVVRECMEALIEGDEHRLLNLLARDAVLYGDGGGRVPSVLNPIYGADRIARFFLGLMKKLPGAYSARLGHFNGEPALLVNADDRPSVLALAVDGERITALYSISNPEKLSAVGF